VVLLGLCLLGVLSGAFRSDDKPDPAPVVTPKEGAMAPKEGRGDPRPAEGRGKKPTPPDTEEKEPSRGLTPEEQVKRSLAGLKSKDPKERAAAAKALGRAGPQAEGALPDLAEALGDLDGTVRRHAFAALMKIGKGPDAAVEGLLKALRSKDREIRRDAAGKLGVLGPRAGKAAPALGALLADPETRPQALGALVRVGKPAVPVLVQALKSKVEPIRRSAAQALGQMGDKATEAIGPLIALFEDPPTYRDVVVALGKIGKPAVPALVKALESGEEEVRRGAATALGHIGGAAEDALPQLKTLSRTDPSMSVRLAAGVAVERIQRAR
jgi:HEAT repeat protein